MKGDGLCLQTEQTDPRWCGGKSCAPGSQENRAWLSGARLFEGFFHGSLHYMGKGFKANGAF